MATVLSWNEIRDRATKFSREWKDETRESGEYQTFWDEFFGIFGVQRRSVALYQQAVKRYGGSTGFIDLFWAGKLIAEHKSAGESLDSAYEQAQEYANALPEEKRPRYIIVSDYANMRLYDLEGNEGVEMNEFALTDLPKHIRLFGFIAGYEVRKYRDEDPVNRRAVKVVVKLYSALAKSNYDRASLEKLLVRLVFCYFADDSGIFPPGNPFYYYLAIGSHNGGSDFGARLNAVFSTLNTPSDKRQTTLDERLAELPYVNGGLFADQLPFVSFDADMLQAVLDASEFNWAAVSPAIFGSMFQFVTDEHNATARHDLGAHYTSEKNIRKVIDGLFMDSLRAELAAAGKSTDKLTALWNKVGGISLLDPACGCGNFLVVAYRELRSLELDILKRLHPQAREVEGAGQHVLSMQLDAANLSKLSLENLYGIEIESFPAEIARLSLWLADHLSNIELGDYFGTPFARLPLTQSAHITVGNALTLDWNEVVLKDNLSYIIGNPPFIGSRVMDASQKADMVAVFGNVRGVGELDYVTTWFRKAAEFTKDTPITCAFVSTNSVSQGEQVAILWNELARFDTHIHFAHRTFKWSNEAPGQAAVFCVIIGFGSQAPSKARLFEYDTPNGEAHEVYATEINPYLVAAPTILIESRRKPLSVDIPEIGIGNKPIDGGHYLFTAEEKAEFLVIEPDAAAYFRPWLGAQEFLNGGERWCLWAGDAEPEKLRAMPEVLKRIDAVRQYRLASTSAPTRVLAQTPTRFHVENMPDGEYILIPSTSSERRKYIPIGFIDKNVITSNSCHIISNATLYHFGVLESEMHMTWMRAVAGRLKSDYRYSKDIVYNNFPWPEPNESAQQKIEEEAQGVLDARAVFPNATLADLYDPNTMPPALQDAHKKLDRAVDSAYGVSKSFTSEAARLEFLFVLYKKLTTKNKK